MRSHLAPRRASSTPLLAVTLMLALAVVAPPALAQRAGTPAPPPKSPSKQGATKSSATKSSATKSSATKSSATKPSTTRSSTTKPTATKSSAAKSPAPSAKTAPLPAPVVAAPPRDSIAPDARRAARAINVYEGPGGRALARLEPNTVVTPLVRERGWVKVRVEAWVPERDLLPADTSVATQLAAAELRADPEGTRGRAVRWEVELLAFQVADALRKELAPDEPYLLARGPGEENAMLYLALPPSLVQTARELPPLTRLLVTARVRNGRSAPAGVPVLDLLTLVPLRRS